MILITGAFGYIGQHVARRFVDIGEQVVATFHRNRVEASFLKEEIGRSVFPERIDIADSADWLRLGAAYPITGIVHMAAPGVDNNRLPPHKEFQTNIQGLYNALQFGEAWKVRRLTITSSAAVFAGVPEGPFREDTALPIEPSAWADSGTEIYKKVMESLGAYHAVVAGLDVVSARISTYWGPCYCHGRTRRPQQQILAMCRAVLNGTAPDFGNLAGGSPFAESGADMTYVKDGAKAVQMVHSAPKLSHRIYHVSSGRFTTMAEVAAALGEIAPDFRVSLQRGTGPGWKPNAQLDNGRLVEDTGFTPDFPLPRALADYIDWLRVNEF